MEQIITFPIELIHIKSFYNKKKKKKELNELGHLLWLLIKKERQCKIQSPQMFMNLHSTMHTS
jgi:hypothetical protein